VRDEWVGRERLLARRRGNSWLPSDGKSDNLNVARPGIRGMSVAFNKRKNMGRDA